MRTTDSNSISNTAKQASEIYVVENPDGIFVARVKGSAGLEAEGKMMDLLQSWLEAKEVLHKQDVAADPNGIVDEEE